MHRIQLPHHHHALLPILLSLVLLASPSVGATEAGSRLPTLIVAVATSPETGRVTVSGEGFSPGGAVYVALYDRWGATRHETRWVTASPTVYGRDGSADPAAGYHRGGTLDEVFANLCDATPMVRAYDRETATWSNWLDIHPGC